MTNFDLSNRVAFVTGGNGGIGLGMAKGLAAAGATVVIAGRNKAKAQDALAALGPRAEFVELDVLKEESCRAAVAQVAERLGRLDILVNNAGTTVRKQPQELSADEWRHVMDTNLTGAFLCSQAAYPHMVRGGGGKIINTGSMMSVMASSYAAPYAASKGGIVQMAKSLAVAWAKDNIQVNTIRSAGAIRPTSPVSRCFSQAPRRISSPAPRSRSMAATRCRSDVRPQACVRS